MRTRKPPSRTPPRARPVRVASSIAVNRRRLGRADARTARNETPARRRPPPTRRARPRDARTLKKSKKNTAAHERRRTTTTGGRRAAGPFIHSFIHPTTTMSPNPNPETPYNTSRNHEMRLARTCERIHTHAAYTARNAALLRAHDAECPNRRRRRRLRVSVARAPHTMARRARHGARERTTRTRTRTISRAMRARDARADEEGDDDARRLGPQARDVGDGDCYYDDDDDDEDEDDEEGVARGGLGYYYYPSPMSGSPSTPTTAQVRVRVRDAGGRAR